MLSRSIYSLFLLAILMASGDAVVDKPTGLWQSDATHSDVIEGDNSSDPVDSDDDAKALANDSQRNEQFQLVLITLEADNIRLFTYSSLPPIRAPPQVS